MRKLIKQLAIFSIVLMMSLTINPNLNFAQANGPEAFNLDAAALEALDESLHINTATKTVHVDRELALSAYDFTDEQLDAVQSELDQLTEDEVNALINYSLENAEDGMQLRSASVIIWVGVAVIIGIIATTSLFFSSKYMNYKEK